MGYGSDLRYQFGALKEWWFRRYSFVMHVSGVFRGLNDACVVRNPGGVCPFQSIGRRQTLQSWGKLPSASDGGCVCIDICVYVWIQRFKLIDLVGTQAFRGVFYFINWYGFVLQDLCKEFSSADSARQVISLLPCVLEWFVSCVCTHAHRFVFTVIIDSYLVLPVF